MKPEGLQMLLGILNKAFDKTHKSMGNSDVKDIML